MKVYRQCLMKTQDGMPFPQHSVTVHGVGRQVLKWNVKGRQNPILIFGRKVKYEKTKLYYAVRYVNPFAVTVRNKTENNNQLRHAGPSARFQVPLTGHICVLHSSNSIVLKVSKYYILVSVLVVWFNKIWEQLKNHSYYPATNCQFLTCSYVIIDGGKYRGTRQCESANCGNVICLRERHLLVRRVENTVLFLDLI
jgi:hypothetical protein